MSLLHSTRIRHNARLIREIHLFSLKLEINLTEMIQELGECLFRIRPLWNTYLSLVHYNAHPEFFLRAPLWLSCEIFVSHLLLGY